ncbi:MAG: Bug family tripartite tricarboxylate transporter substrate binding protein, partial [Lautropia sp.]
DPDYPSRAIQIVVPYAAGGVNDVLARLIARELSEKFGKPVVVENRPGANGIVGADLVKRSAPDGYTLLQGATGPNGANAALYDRLPYDPLKDFEPVALVGTTPMVVYINDKVPAKTLSELVALSKARPGSLSYGVGSSVHQLAMELLKTRTGADLTYVSYRGGTPALTDVIAGQIQVGMDGIQTPLPAIRQGRIRGIAVSTATRSAALPETPTMIESGVGNYDIAAWSALFAPAKTPPAILDKLHTVINEALRKPEVREKLAELGVDAGKESRAAFAARQVRDIADYKKAAADAKLPKLD